MKTIKLLIAVIFFLTSTALFSQYVTYDSDQDKDELYQTYGPNQKHFSHFYVGFGMFTDKAETGAEVNYGKTNSFQLGMRYKLRLNKTFALGYDFSWSKQSFNLKQNDDKILPNNFVNNNEKLVFNNLGLELYYRINLGTNATKMGTFLDMGAYGNWAYRNKHVTVNDFEDDLGLLYNRRIVTNRKLVYTQPLNYGVRGRIGYNRYVLMGEYRLSSLFKDEYNLPELPKFQLSLQIGIHM
jgi:hypothetical protein